MHRQSCGLARVSKFSLVLTLVMTPSCALAHGSAESCIPKRSFPEIPRGSSLPRRMLVPWTFRPIANYCLKEYAAAILSSCPNLSRNFWVVNA